MSAAPTLPEQLLTALMPRKRFTRSEYEHLVDSGFFEGQRLELIDGELIDKMGQNVPHSIAIRLLLGWLTRLFGGERILVQLPIDVSCEDRERSVPEPDLAVAIEMQPEHHRRQPRGDELLVVIEVSDTSVAFDLSRKATLYARAGVREYWVLDVNKRVLTVHREPDGVRYRSIHVYGETDLVTLEGRTEQLIVRDVLPLPE